MAIKNITTDYTGRKKDISILHSPDASSPDTQDVAPKFGKSVAFCGGVQSLVQRYMVLLLTNVNSQPLYPEFGVNFLHTLQQGISPVDRLAAAQIFTLASYSAVVQLQAYQSTKRDIPTDERIANAQLLRMSLLGGYVAFDVKINTEAGESVDFVVPLLNN